MLEQILFVIIGAFIGSKLAGVTGARIGAVIGLILSFIKRPKPKRKKLKMDELAEVFRKKGTRCEDCGTRENLTVHHIRPLSKGGTNRMSNLTILCKSCNSKRGNRY